MSNQAVNQEQTNDGLTFRDIWHFLKKAMPAIIVCVLISCMLVTMIGLIIRNTSKTSNSANGVLNISYAGIEKGLDPLGLPFNKDEIRSTQILSEVLSNLNLSYNVGDVRNAITISGIVPASYTKMIDELKKNGKFTLADLEKLAYHPTSFSITLNSKYVKNISETEARNIVDELMKVYIYRTQKKYMDISTFSTTIMTDEQIRANDFAEVISVISSQLNSVNSYIVKMSKEHGDFVGSNNLTFASLSSQLNLLYEQYVVLFAEIKSNGIARDRAKTLDYLDSKITELSSTIAAKEETLKKIGEYIKSFKEQFPTFDFGTGGGSGGSITISTPQSEAFQTMFLRQLTEAEEIERLTVDKTNFTNWKAKLEANSTVLDEQKATEITNRIITIKNNFAAILASSNTMLKEFKQADLFINIHVSSNAIIQSDAKDIPWLLLLAATIVGGSIIGMVSTPVIAKIKSSRRAKLSKSVSDSDQK